MKSRFKFLVIGGDGLIGAALVQFLKKAKESFIYTSRRKTYIPPDYLHLNLSEKQFDWNEIDRADVAIFCAGMTKVDVCEKKKISSRLVNVENVHKLARILADQGARIVYLSSNAVFDGSKEYPSHEDAVSPITEYGRQKVEVEKQLIEEYPSLVTILRLTKVLGSLNPLFDDWSLALKRGDPIQPFSDMYIAPIPLSFVVSVVRLVVDQNVKGILHLSGDKDFSYADIALMASNWLGSKKDQVRPISVGESNLHESVIRSSKTALDICRLKCELGIMAPPSLWTLKNAFLNPKCLNGA
jgi:dTDP-4-dehydrorhamnose reductase